MAAIIAMAAIGGWCIATGRISYVVTDGVSMNPVYYQNDLVFVVREDRYRPGDIAAYSGSIPGLKVLHRIVGGSETSGFVFKGDHNPVRDPAVVQTARIIGRAVLHVPQGGVWLKPLLSPTGLGMMGFLIVGGGAAIPRNRREVPRGRRKKKVKAMERQGGLGAIATTTVATVKRLPPPQQVAAGLIAFLAMLGLTLGVFGWIKPTLEQLPATGPTRSMSYSYSATVPKSPAYDGIVVTSPDPIFRKLTNVVTVHFHYVGPAGTVTTSAVLSSDSGWHSTVPLTSSRRSTGTSYDGVVSLNLTSFDQRAAAAAQATGFQIETVGVTITTTVTSNGIPAFTAPLPLSLNPLQLALDGGKDKLLVTDSSLTSGPSLVARQLTIASRPMLSAAGARGWAVLLLIMAAAGAAGIYLAASRSGPLHNRAQIERRFPQLLVQVEPMVSPPGKPVVTVDNFPALVKLAERYGQMILTWRRPEADDFVVRDDGITYRYRVLLDEPALQNVEIIDRPGSHRRAASEVS